jgi:FKBP-type peptidyl-prolyl cis-trans isomerase
MIPLKANITILISAIVAVLFFSCKDNDLEKQRERELQELDEYISNNFPDEDPTASGLFYIELEEGTGDSINIGDKVQIFYELMTLDSNLVASSGNYEPLQVIVQPPTQLSSSASDVNELLGLHEALTYMKRGTKALLIMPSQLAFGQYGSYSVGGFKTLLMEVEVYKVFPLNVSEN